MLNKYIMYSWKWSLGEAYYKSARNVKQQESQITISNGNDSQLSAINCSLNEPETFDSNFGFENNNRREILDNKMAGRELVLQRGSNPFLQQSSYVNDIVVRDMFLKPVNTTQGRVKNNEGEQEQTL
jgi:hypothetical protein